MAVTSIAVKIERSQVQMYLVPSLRGPESGASRQAAWRCGWQHRTICALGLVQQGRVVVGPRACPLHADKSRFAGDSLDLGTIPKTFRRSA